jgi:hypothetical protein
MSEELLVQRFGLFSYWKSSPLSTELRRPIRGLLGDLEQREVNGDVLLVRRAPGISNPPRDPQPD